MISILKQYYREPLYRNSIAIILNSVLNALFGFFFWIVAARTMSTNDIGLATAAISMAALIVGLSRLGLDAGLVRYLPETHNKSGLYSTIVSVTLALSLILAILFLLNISFFSPALVFLRDGWVLPAFLGYVAISSVYYMQNRVFITIRRAELSLLQNLLTGIRIPILLLIEYLGIISILSSISIAFLITFISGTFVLQRCGISLKRKLDISELRKIFKFSLGNYTSVIFTMAPTTIIPLMIVNTIGAEDNAFFYVAYSIAGLLTMIPAAVSLSLFVEGSHNIPLKENVVKSVKMIMLLLLPSIVFIYLFGDKLLLLYGEEYAKEAIEMLRLLAVSSIFSAVISIFLSIQKIQKNIKTVNYTNFILSILIIVLGYISLLKYGLIGLGYAWLVANMVVGMGVVGVIVLKEKWV